MWLSGMGLMALFMLFIVPTGRIPWSSSGATPLTFSRELS